MMNQNILRMGREIHLIRTQDTPTFVLLEGCFVLVVLLMVVTNKHMFLCRMSTVRCMFADEVSLTLAFFVFTFTT